MKVKSKNLVVLKKNTYQSMDAYIYMEPEKAKPGEMVSIVGYGFTAFLERGNPGIPILIDNRPLTGVKLRSDGTFRIKIKMPPFTAGEHILSAFGVNVQIQVEETEDIISATQLQEIIERDFKLTEDCHMLLSDEKYRVCPIDVLKCYLNKSDVPSKTYIAEWFDCDDFSDALHGQFTFDTYSKGYAHGELWVILGNGGGHAINCFCVKDTDGKNKMVVVEPQDGRISAFPDNWKAFMVKI